MLQHCKLQKLDDYFLPLGGRTAKGVYFYRLNQYSDEIAEFLKKYYDVARRSGVVIEGKIPNPDEKNLSYYGEIMGMDFQLNANFIISSLQKWLPRMNNFQRQNVGEAIYDSLIRMQKSGKTENMLKNAYIKFMCWLYYKFERIVNQLGEEQLPKILYEGSVSTYELMLISILSNAGCDVVLLQYQGDNSYLKLDPSSALSIPYCGGSMTSFPAEFSLKYIQKEIQRDFNNQRLYGALPQVHNCTNAWTDKKAIESIEQNSGVRGNDRSVYYNGFFRIYGTEDKLLYSNELLKLQQTLKNNGRKLLIFNGEIPMPENREIVAIHRDNYRSMDQMIPGLSKNFSSISNTELRNIIHKNFVDFMLEEEKKEGQNINRLTSKAVILLCWLHRYMAQLFANWKNPEIACCIHMGPCKNENEAFFLRFLARLPADVLILCPNLNARCCLEDSLLREETYPESLCMEKFPDGKSQFRIGTAAYHAERDLDTLLYRDTGMYREQQYAKANVISLQTMYEEIRILWNQEVKYRPNFSTTDSLVNIPVICSKVSGVWRGQEDQYWLSIKELITEDTIVIKNPPYIPEMAPNPMKIYAPEFYKNGKLLKNKIKNHPHFPYRLLRNDMQDFILDEIETIIDRKLIRGTGENGMEYTVIAQALNIPKDILRLLQKFDFTKKNPKIIYINTTDTVVSVEDSILLALLNSIGFDIVCFVPTGYNCVECHYNYSIFEEHQIGPYQYDLEIPNFDELVLTNACTNLISKIFKRGI